MASPLSVPESRSCWHIVGTLPSLDWPGLDAMLSLEVETPSEPE